MKKVVLFVAGDPGGASALLPVMNQWGKTGKAVVAYRQAVQLFSEKGVAFRKLSEIGVSLAKAEAWLKAAQARCVCGSTSVNGVDWERYFFLAARKLEIPSVAVLDYWSNYAARFTLSQRLDALPDVIAIMDKRAEREMIAEGFPPEKLHITGQPVLDEAREWRKGLAKENRMAFRARLGLEVDDYIALFISQPLEEMDRLADPHLGVTLNDFAILQRVALEVARRNQPSAILWIKLHPRESADKYDGVLGTLPCRARIVTLRHCRWEICMAADEIIGVSSMLLEEALVVGCPIKRMARDGSTVSTEDPPLSTAASAEGLPLARELIAQMVAENSR